MKPAKPGGRLEARIRHKRGNLTAGMAIILAAGALGAVVMAFLLLSQNLAQAHRDVDLLTAQVKSLGGTPVAGPKGDKGAAGVGLVGPSGPPGATGGRGESGKPGKDAPTLTPSPGPTGPSGPSGAPGADSTVPGPTGSIGPAGRDATGAPGEDGRDGSPPSDWSYTDQDGNEYHCVPVENFDPDRPQYRCTQTTTPSPTPTPADSKTASADPSPSANPSPTDSGPLVVLLKKLL